MSAHIPFDIQSEIIKRLPVKSLVQFRSVSKQWKSLIDSPQFIKTYHVNRTNPKYHLLLRYTLDRVPTYTLIVDDDTFPKQKFTLTTPEPVNSLKLASVLGSVDGLLCFDGWYEYTMRMVVLWNPSIRKSAGIPIPPELCHVTRLGFGVCRDTSDPKLVKINVYERVTDEFWEVKINFFERTPIVYEWEVQVFTLSSRVWRTIYWGVPFTPCDLFSDHVCIDGIIYWSTSGRFIISFDLKSEKFGEVCLPERLAIQLSILEVVKVNESLGLLESYHEGVQPVCDVWMRKDGVDKPFTKIYTVKVAFNRVLGFRNNGEVVIAMVNEGFSKSQIVVYEPSSRRIISVGISGESRTFTVWSYMETLLLLDQSNSVIH